MKERCIVLQLPLMGLIHLILPLLFQLRNALANAEKSHSNSAPSLLSIYCLALKNVFSNISNRTL